MKETALLAYCIPGVREAGCDEAGRGPLAGSVFAAAVILPPVIPDGLRGLNDSKQLTEHPYIPAGEVMEIPARSVVKGDAKYMSIAAASILAKTYRDAYMNRLHVEYPMYRWNENKGYPTRAHYEALRQFGPTPYHRKSFKLIVDS